MNEIQQYIQQDLGNDDIHTVLPEYCILVPTHTHTLCMKAFMISDVTATEMRSRMCFGICIYYVQTDSTALWSQ